MPLAQAWRVHPFMIPDTDSNNVVLPLAPVARASSGSTETHEWGARQSAGTFDAWICATCGYTEWYAANVNQKLAELSQNPQSGVTYLDADAQQAPYR